MFFTFFKLVATSFVGSFFCGNTICLFDYVKIDYPVGFFTYDHKNQPSM